MDVRAHACSPALELREPSPFGHQPHGEVLSSWRKGAHNLTRKTGEQVKAPFFSFLRYLQNLWPTGSQTASIGKGVEQGPVPFGAALGLFLLLRVLTKPWVTDPGDLPIYPCQKSNSTRLRRSLRLWGCQKLFLRPTHFSTKQMWLLKAKVWGPQQEGD